MPVYRITGEVTREVIALVEAPTEVAAVLRYERGDVDEVESDAILCSAEVIKITPAEGSP